MTVLKSRLIGDLIEFKIQSLEKELRQAKKTIETTQKEKRDLEQVNKYQQERLQKTIEEIDAAQKEVASLNKQSKEAEEKYHTLLEQMRQKLEETKRESEEKDRHISDMEQAQIQLQCSVARVLNTAMLQKQNRVPNKEAKWAKNFLPPSESSGKAESGRFKR